MGKPIFWVVADVLRNLESSGFFIEADAAHGSITIWDVMDSEKQIGWTLKITSGPHVREVEHV